MSYGNHVSLALLSSLGTSLFYLLVRVPWPVSPIRPVHADRKPRDVAVFDQLGRLVRLLPPRARNRQSFVVSKHLFQHPIPHRDNSLALVVLNAIIAPPRLSPQLVAHELRRLGATSAFIYATVLGAVIHSQVNDGRVTTYMAGQSFSELPGCGAQCRRHISLERARFPVAPSLHGIPRVGSLASSAIQSTPTSCRPLPRRFVSFASQHRRCTLGFVPADTRSYRLRSRGC
jgi:hypothetical protein